MKDSEKTTPCQSRGRHEYRIVHETATERHGICACGVTVSETKGKK
jgi:hypothetical protein